MILAIDVGNTHTVLGLIEDGKISSVAPRIVSDVHKTDYEYAVAIESVLDFVGVDATEAEGAILSSVVGPLTSTLQSAVKMLTGKSALVVGAGIKTGLNICIDDPGQVGADLVVGAVGALAVAEAPIIVIDMGTATTVTVVDEGSRFLGGAILPGLQLSMEALSSGTSLLPRVSLDAPKKVISTNTIECMQSGAIFGSASMIDGMIERMEAELGRKCAVVATGGLSGVVAPYCKRDILLEPDLLLKGLSILWEKNRRAQRT